MKAQHKFSFIIFDIQHIQTCAFAYTSAMIQYLAPALM
ncbi:MAG: hypothetical protein OFPI_42940 [Osedax symbiont Rs2]|nr:MAG: hypothetical protein OFPI_42940 [Osedax symbiont Rs2]